MSDLNTYYKSQIYKITDNPLTSRTIQIQNNGKQTNWLSLNDESATEIVKFLETYYNIKK